jgi:hypothetical protein
VYRETAGKSGEAESRAALARWEETVKPLFPGGQENPSPDRVVVMVLDARREVEERSEALQKWDRTLRPFFPEADRVSPSLAAEQIKQLRQYHSQDQAALKTAGAARDKAQEELDAWRRALKSSFGKEVVTAEDVTGRLTALQTKIRDLESALKLQGNALAETRKSLDAFRKPNDDVKTEMERLKSTIGELKGTLSDEEKARLEQAEAKLRRLEISRGEFTLSPSAAKFPDYPIKKYTLSTIDKNRNEQHWDVWVCANARGAELGSKAFAELLPILLRPHNEAASTNRAK